jgi:DNA invertase Pin-like site-specific DNA recombinase
MDTVRVALYSRVSTRDKGQDAQNQLRHLREFCAKQGYEIVREYVDQASGKHSDRDAFRQLFSAAARCDFDMVLFWSLDRFSREGAFETLQHLQRLTVSDIAASRSNIWILAACSAMR